MFFGKKQTGMMNQMPAVNMVNDGYGPGQFTPEGMYPDQTPMGYGAEPYGYYGPGMEHVGMEHMEHVGMEAERPSPRSVCSRKREILFNKIATKVWFRLAYTRRI